jgi:phage tail-like protein
VADLSPHLLPYNATPFEVALDRCEERVLDIPVPLRDLWRPETCPAHLLPFLAWGLSVDLWEDDWREGRKRRICAEALRLHRLKGTLDGVKRLLSYIDTRVVEAVLPPQRIFAKPADPERQARFRSRFAQLRVYPFRSREQADFNAAYAGRCLVGSAATVVSTAWKRYGKRAAIWDNGQETPVRWSTLAPIFSPQVAVPVERIVVPARAGSTDALTGRIAAGGQRSFATSRPPRSRLLSIGREASWDALRRPSIAPGSHGLNVINVAPERVLERGIGKARSFFVGSTVSTFVTPNEAALRIYDRYYLLDENRISRAEGTSLGPFVGDRISIAPFSAWFRVERFFRMTGRTFHVGHGVGGAARPQAARLASVARALQASAVYRDTLKFTTRTRAIIGFADAPAFEDAPAFGALVEIRRAA